MPVGFSGASHVFAGESSADDGVVVMLDPSPPEFDVVEAGGVAGDPDVPAGLKFGVDDETPEALVHFQTLNGSDMKVKIMKTRPSGQR